MLQKLLKVVCCLQVKPLLSLDNDEARVRVLALYRAWYRQLPVIAKDWDLPITEKALKDRLKAEFLKHAHIKDTRVIDMKVILVSIPKHDSNNTRAM